MAAWMEQCSSVDKTFLPWCRFALRDYTAHMALKPALRTGTFKLRLPALRRIAPIFCGHGKDRYQWLSVVHLSHMAWTMDNDMEASSHPFSTPLTENPLARLGLDEQQEFEDKL